MITDAPRESRTATFAVPGAVPVIVRRLPAALAVTAARLVLSAKYGEVPPEMVNVCEVPGTTVKFDGAEVNSATLGPTVIDSVMEAPAESLIWITPVPFPTGVSVMAPPTLVARTTASLLLATA
jgi:hypothetical protein